MVGTHERVLQRAMGIYEAVRRDEDRQVESTEISSTDVESSLLNSSRSDGNPKGGVGNSSKGRLVSLDVFRGLTVAVFLFS